MARQKKKKLTNLELVNTAIKYFGVPWTDEEREAYDKHRSTGVGQGEFSVRMSKGLPPDVRSTKERQDIPEINREVKSIEGLRGSVDPFRLGQDGTEGITDALVDIIWKPYETLTRPPFTKDKLRSWLDGKIPHTQFVLLDDDFRDQLRLSVVMKGVGIICVTRYGYLDIPPEELDTLCEPYRISENTMYYQLKLDVLRSRLEQIPDVVPVETVRKVRDKALLVTAPEPFPHLCAADSIGLPTCNGSGDHEITTRKAG